MYTSYMHVYHNNYIATCINILMVIHVQGYVVIEMLLQEKHMS
jgi:hypothetical protein